MPELQAKLEARPPVDLDFRLDVDATLPSLTLQILDGGTPVDLVGGTALFSMEDLQGNAKITGAAAVIEDPVNGIVRYDWVTGDTDTEGVFVGQFQITIASRQYLQPNNAAERLRILIGRVEASAVPPLPSTILHAPNHILGGIDVIDADRLDITFDPTNYTPDSSPPEAGNVDHLTAHLAGIDDELANIISTPLPHAPSHQDGGTDELPVDTLAESAAPTNDTSRALRPDGTGGVEFLDISHSELIGVTANDHHTEDHATRHSNGGADEVTVENLGTVSIDASTALRPDGAGGLAFSDVDHSDLTGVGADDHHAQDHAARHADGAADELSVDTLAEAAVPGNDVSQALRPDGGGGVEFRDVGHSELTGIGNDDHHAEDHAARHSDGGADEVTVENLGTASIDTSTALRPDGLGGLAFVDVDHSELTGVGTDDHHAQDHQARHADGGADELPVDTMAEAVAPSNDVSRALRPDGLGGVVFVDVDHSELTGVGVDDHHAQDHSARHQDGGADELPADTLAEAAVPTNDTSRALRPDGTGGVAFVDVDHSELTGVGADDHHTEDHQARHRDGGADELPVVHLAEDDTPTNDTSRALRPNGTGGVVFADVDHTELTGITNDDHHTEDHQARHRDGGLDELPVVHLAEADVPTNDTSRALRPNGTGGVVFADVDHTELTGITNDDHHTEDHQARHRDGGADELPVAHLAENDTPTNDVSRALRPDGSGGVEFRDVDHTELTGITPDDHHTEDHAPRHLSGAADEVDADRLDIDFVPGDYDRSTTPTEVTLVVELTAHLAGIDDGIGDNKMRAWFY